MKLLASLAALVCVLVLVPAAHARAPRAVDFELAPRAAAASAGGAVVSRPLRAPRAFNLVGMRWRGDALPDVDLRVRRGSRWSRWQHVGVHGDGGSDPLWVGQARTVQYRLSRRVPGVRLHFVAVGKRRGAARGARARAAQVETPFPYVTRAQWGASQCQPRDRPTYAEVRSVAVHHTVSLNDYSRAEAPRMVLAICRYHRNSNGWDDVGYNALVDKYGTIYEGRAGGLDQAVMGAHAQGFNSQTAAISHIGDHSNLAQTAEGLAATANYIRWKLAVHGQPASGPVTVTSSGGSASRYPAGARVTVERVIGHRDLGRTACPGDELYGQLDDIRAMVETGAAFVPSSATRVHAALATRRVDYGEFVPVSGSLVGPDGAPLAGQTVQLQVNSEGAWRTVRRPVTDGNGAYLVGDLKPAKRMYVRVRYPGAGELRRSVSSRLLLRLRPLVTFRRPPARAERGRRVRIAGAVSPRKRVVHVVLQQRIRGRWRKVGAQAVRARRGRFRTSFVPAFAARYRYYAAVKFDEDTDRATSGMRHLRVTR